MVSIDGDEKWPKDIPANKINQNAKKTDGDGPKCQLERFFKTKLNKK